MTTVLIIGDKADGAIERLIKTELSKTYEITYVKGDRVSRTGTGYGILALDADNISECDLSECIVLMKRGGEIPQCRLPERTIIIVNSENVRQLELLQRTRCRVITCGKSRRDTLSFTSVTPDALMVSLSRGITAFSGRVIEPLEIPVRLTAETDALTCDSVYEPMAFTALRLVLDDVNSEIGPLYDESDINDFGENTFQQ